MKPTLINHPLRPIRLEYKSDDCLTVFEEQCIMEYVKLHDKLHEQRNMQRSMHPQIFPLELIVISCELQLAKLEELLGKCGVLVGLPKYKPGIDPKEYTINVDGIVRLAEEAQKKLDECYEAIRPLADQYDLWVEKNLALRDEVEEFKYTYEYADMEILYSLVAEDMQGFDKFMYALLDDNPFVTAYGELVVRYKAYLARVEAAFKRVELLENSTNEISAIEKNKGFGMN